YHNGGCSHTCLDRLDGHQCTCPQDMILAQDELNCINPSARLPGNCYNNNGGCSHHCIVDQKNYHYCTCPKGYKLLSNQQGSKHYGSCSQSNHSCQHICVDIDSTNYYCRCLLGYQLMQNGYNCRKSNLNNELSILDGSCRQSNGYCQHLCVDISDEGHYCLCRKGYSLNQDRRTCSQRNDYNSNLKRLLRGPCYNIGSSCSHFCHTVRNYHYCSCPLGYDLMPDNTTC
ncbi:uncharacterized protein TRIADDRAFT_4313, partial [Trichoplax adhaerens]